MESFIRHVSLISHLHSFQLRKGIDSVSYSRISLSETSQGSVRIDRTVTGLNKQNLTL